MSDTGTDRHYYQIRTELVAYARKLGMCDQEAEDKVHAALLKAWDKKGVLGTLELGLPYLKTMVKNLWIDAKRGDRKDLWPDEEFVHQEPTCQENGDELLDLLEMALEKHKYGYIILEMEKRKLRSIKELAPYVNQKKEKLYKRYQKLVRDLKKEFVREKGL